MINNDANYASTALPTVGLLASQARAASGLDCSERTKMTARYL